MLPIHLDLGFTQIYFYEGIYFLISIVLGVWWCKLRVEKYGGKIEKFELHSTIQNFYMTCSISRSSETMSMCVDQINNKKLVAE